MKEYLNALNYVMENGIDKSDRTGVGIRSIFGYQMRFNLQKGFPAITTKKLAFKKYYESKKNRHTEVKKESTGNL